MPSLATRSRAQWEQARQGLAPEGRATPFGGFKQSGFGRDRSPHAIDKYTDLKTLWTAYK